MKATPCVSCGNSLSVASSGVIVAAGMVMVAVKATSTATTETPKIHFISVVLSCEVHHCNEVAHNSKGCRAAQSRTELERPMLYQLPRRPNGFSAFWHYPVQKT